MQSPRASSLARYLLGAYVLLVIYALSMIVAPPPIDPDAVH